MSMQHVTRVHVSNQCAEGYKSCYTCVYTLLHIDIHVCGEFLDIHTYRYTLRLRAYLEESTENKFHCRVYVAYQCVVLQCIIVGKIRYIVGALV